MPNREDNIKEQVKELWKLCFQDTDAFTDMYFRLRYSEDVNIVIEREGKVVSALQMIPYPMTFCGHTVRTSYISGACTHPDFRGCGVMRELLAQAHTRMRSNGVAFSTLIPAEPWLFDYYARMGYAPVFRYAIHELDVPDATLSEDMVVHPISGYQEEVYRYADKKLSERPSCIQHTAEDFRVIMEDLALSGDFLYVARRNNRICGMAAVYKEDERALIKELFADDKEVEQSLYHFIKQHSDCRRMVRLTPPVDDTLPAHSFGMARVIDAPGVLRLYAAAFPEKEMLLEVRDEQLPANNGYYCLRKGECTYSAERMPGSYISVSMSELANRIWMPLHPYMSLMLN